MKTLVRKKLQLAIKIQHILILCYRVWLDNRIHKQRKLNSPDILRLSSKQHKHIFRFMTLKQQLKEI